MLCCDPFAFATRGPPANAHRVFPRVARRVVTSFDLLNDVFNTVLALSLTQQWATQEQQVFWNILCVSLVAILFCDAYPGRRFVFAGFGVGTFCMSVALGFTYFGLYQVELRDVPFLNGRVNSRNRLMGFQAASVIYFIRFSVLAFRYPHRFVTLPGVELCTVSSAEAFTFLSVSQGSPSRMTRHKVACLPARPDGSSALEQATNALRASAAHSGPDSFGALRRELELLCRERATHGELRQSADDSSTVVMLLPVFRSTVVDEGESCGAALLHSRGPGPGSLVAVLVLCASWPLSFALTMAALLGEAPTGAALAITSLSALASALRLLQGSTMILRLLARKFDTWLAFGYVVFTAASGCVALAPDPNLAALWCVSQTLLPIVLLYDSLPVASGVVGRAHRLTFFPAYLVFCIACAGLLHTERFAGQSVEIRVFGIAQSPTQSCLSAHLGLFSLALRYVYRGISTTGELVAVGGLRKTRLAMSGARRLRAAELHVRSKSRRYSFTSTRAQSAKISV